MTWIEYIVCPRCHKKQQALVWYDSTDPLYSDGAVRCHDCECGYQIKDPEWDLTSLPGEILWTI